MVVNNTFSVKNVNSALVFIDPYSAVCRVALLEAGNFVELALRHVKCRHRVIQPIYAGDQGSQFGDGRGRTNNFNE